MKEIKAFVARLKSGNFTKFDLFIVGVLILITLSLIFGKAEAKVLTSENGDQAQVAQIPSQAPIPFQVDLQEWGLLQCQPLSPHQPVYMCRFVQ